MNEDQLGQALAAVRHHPSSSARRLSEHILTGRGEPVTPERARLLLCQLERKGLVRKWKRPGIRSWLWVPVSPINRP